MTTSLAHRVGDLSAAQLMERELSWLSFNARVLQEAADSSVPLIQRLLPLAHDDARLLVERDGGLIGERGAAARLLLYLFERDWGVQLLRGG